jgi:hypothetical protein
MLMYTTKTISVIIITICAAITTISSLLLFSPSQQIQLIQNGNDYNAFAYHGKEISQTLNYAQFLPLTSNNQSHQVKVIVNYSVMEPSIVNKNMNAIMQLFASNGTLIKTSSFPNGFIINSTSGQSQLATTITDNAVKNVKAVVMFSNATKNANFSNPLSIDLNLGQKIPP